MYTSAFSSFSVKDLDEAEKFYNQKLNISTNRNEMGLLELNIEGGHRVLIYPKPDHHPASFTVLNFKVDDIEKTADTLNDLGVQFEQYDHPKTNDKGIHEGHDPRIAWFKDPSGNILSIIEN